jgi:hypothetical protein
MHEMGCSIWTRMLFFNRLFGTTYRSHFQELSNSIFYVAFLLMSNRFLWCDTMLPARYLPTFWRKWCLHNSSSLKLETAISFKVLVTASQIAWHYISEYNNFHIHRHEYFIIQSTSNKIFLLKMSVFWGLCDIFTYETCCRSSHLHVSLLFQSIFVAGRISDYEVTSCTIGTTLLPFAGK